MRLSRCLLLLLAITSLAVCNLSAQTSGTKKWSFATQAAVDGSPAIGNDGTIYITSSDGFLYSINPYSGLQNWSLNLNNANPSSGNISYITSSPVIGQNGFIYVFSLDGNLHEIDPSNPDGQTTTFVSSSENVSSPAIGSDGTIYLTVDDFAVFSVQQNSDGTFPQSATLLFNGISDIESSPVIGPDCTIYFLVATDSGEPGLCAINPDGSQKWQSPFPLNVPDDEQDFIMPLTVGTDGTIYTITNSDFSDFPPDFRQDRLIAINPNDPNNPGNPVALWVFPPPDQPAVGPMESSPAIGIDGNTGEPNGTIYVGAGDNNLYALDSSDGSVRWTFALATAPINSSPAVAADGTIYVGSADGNLYAINPDGSEKWAFTGTANSEIISSPAVASDGTVIVGSDDGNVYAVYGSAPLADTPWPMYRKNLTHIASQSTGNCGLGTDCVLPYIIQQPKSVTVAAGATAQFSVLAGPGMLSYQWWQSGVALRDRGNISGSQTATLTITGASIYNAGDCAPFTCVVSDGCASVTSDPAILNFIDLINVQCSVTGATVKTGAAAVPAPPSDFWNDLTIGPEVDGSGVTSSASISCYDSAHNSTSVAVRLFQQTGDEMAGYSDAGFAFDPLMQSLIFPPAGGTYAVLLGGLTNSVAYDIYLYGNGGSSTSRVGSTFTLIRSTSSGSPTTQSCSSANTWNPNIWVEGDQYVVFRGVTPTNRQIAFTVSGAADEINGIQIRSTMRVTGLTAAQSGANVVLNWSALAGAQGYMVMRGTTSGGPYTAISGAITGGITTFTDTHADVDTPYFYVVVLPNVCPDIPTQSNEATATVSQACITAINYSTGVMTISGSADLTWQVQTSSDGSTWTTIGSVILSGGTATFSYPFDPTQLYRVYLSGLSCQLPKSSITGITYDDGTAYHAGAIYATGSPDMNWDVETSSDGGSTWSSIGTLTISGGSGSFGYIENSFDPTVLYRLSSGNFTSDMGICDTSLTITINNPNPLPVYAALYGNGSLIQDGLYIDGNSAGTFSFSGQYGVNYSISANDTEDAYVQGYGFNWMGEMNTMYIDIGHPGDYAGEHAGSGMVMCPP